MDKDKKKKYQKAIILPKKFEPKKKIKELGKKDKIKQIKELLNIEDENNNSNDKDEKDESEGSKIQLLYFTMSWIHIVLDFGHFLYKKKKKLFSSTLSWIFRNFDH